MSRIGKCPVILSSAVKIIIDKNNISAEGPKGKLHYVLPKEVKVEKKTDRLIFNSKNNDKKSRALHGLSRTAVNNMIIGISKGFCKTLKIQGVGYRAHVNSDQNLILNIGYSHSIIMKPPMGISIEVINNTEIQVKGIDKENVGQFAAQIRSKRPPEPYKGKGIRYIDEDMRRKVGKAGK